MTYRCGCSADGDIRCGLHVGFWCHQPIPTGYSRIITEDLCPPCKREKWASVNFDGRATPTRRGGR